MLTTLAVLLPLMFTREAWADLPKPIKSSVVVLAIDRETQSLVVKRGKDEKPFVLDWDRKTNFLKDGESAMPMDLKVGTPATVEFKRLSFRNPLLRSVVWIQRP